MLRIARGAVTGCRQFTHVKKGVRAVASPLPARSVSWNAVRFASAAAPSSGKPANTPDAPNQPSRADELAQQLYHSYLTYWDHIRFRKGWATPQFTVEEVSELLDEAAGYAAHILSKVEAERMGEPMFRQRGGDSLSFLSGVSFKPKDHPQKFVRELVHSTLCDAAGYTLNLTEERIDGEIQALTAERSYAHATGPLLVSFADLKEEIKAVLTSNLDDGSGNVHRTRYHVTRLLQEAEDLIRSGGDVAPEPAQPEKKEVPAGAEQQASQPEREAPVHKPRKIDVTGYTKKVASLVKATDVKWENVKKDPASYEKELEKLQNKCTDSSSVLMKDLLALEQELSAGPSEGKATPANQEDRSRIREQVQVIHKLLENVDEVNRRVQVLKSATQQEKRRQEEGDQAAKAPQKPVSGAQPAEAKATKSAPKAAPKQGSGRTTPAAPEKQDTQARKHRVKMLVSEVIRQLHDSKTWENIEIDPDFSVRNGTHFCYASAFLPFLQTDACRINVNHGELTVRGVCSPPPEELEPRIQHFVNMSMAMSEDEEATNYLLSQGKTPLDFVKLMSEGKWGHFTKSYHLAAPIPAQGVEASYDNNVLRIAIPYPR